MGLAKNVSFKSRIVYKNSNVTISEENQSSYVVRSADETTDKAIASGEVDLTKLLYVDSPTVSDGNDMNGTYEQQKRAY